MQSEPKKLRNATVAATIALLAETFPKGGHVFRL
jgi:hypothetical protein